MTSQPRYIAALHIGCGGGSGHGPNLNIVAIDRGAGHELAAYRAQALPKQGVLIRLQFGRYVVEQGLGANYDKAVLAA